MYSSRSDMYRSKDNLLAAGRCAPSLDTLSGSVQYGSTASHINTRGAPTPFRFWFDNDESVVSRLRKAREKRGSARSWAAGIASYCISRILFALVVAVTLTLPLVEAIVGGMSVGKCPHEPMIPVVLIVGGIMGVLSCGLNVAARGRHLHVDVADPTSRKYVLIGALTGFFNMAVLIAFIIGCVYVYRSLWPSEDPSSAEYCSPGTFYFAFWLHNSVFIFVGLLIFVACSGLLLNAFFC